MSDSIIPVEQYSQNSHLFLTPISDAWKEKDLKNQYPTPQGNLPMIKYLKKHKQTSLMSSYNNVCKLCN